MNITIRILLLFIRRLNGWFPSRFWVKIYVPLMYRRKFRRWPDLKQPKSFNEKLQWRKLYDRDPRYVRIADKIEVRKFVESKLGKDIYAQILWVGNRAEDIPFDRLPPKFVVKANYGSSRTIAVDNKDTCDRNRIVAICQGWLNDKAISLKAPQFNHMIPRKIFVEEYLRPSNDQPLLDFRFFVFHGVAHFIQVNVNMLSKTSKRQAFFTPEWDLMSLAYNNVPMPEFPITKPKNLTKMIESAQELGRDFDFIRVDLYDLGDRIIFGELTPLPVSGFAQFEPRSFDMEAGALWRLAPDLKSRSYGA